MKKKLLLIVLALVFAISCQDVTENISYIKDMPQEELSAKCDTYVDNFSGSFGNFYANFTYTETRINRLIDTLNDYRAKSAICSSCGIDAGSAKEYVYSEGVCGVDSRDAKTNSVKIEEMECPELRDYIEGLTDLKSGDANQSKPIDHCSSFRSLSEYKIIKEKLLSYKPDERLVALIRSADTSITAIRKAYNDSGLNIRAFEAEMLEIENQIKDFEMDWYLPNRNCDVEKFSSCQVPEVIADFCMNSVFNSFYQNPPKESSDQSLCTGGAARPLDVYRAILSDKDSELAKLIQSSYEQLTGSESFSLSEANDSYQKVKASGNLGAVSYFCAHLFSESCPFAGKEQNKEIIEPIFKETTNQFMDRCMDGVKTIDNKYGKDPIYLMDIVYPTKEIRELLDFVSYPSVFIENDNLREDNWWLRYNYSYHKDLSIYFNDDVKAKSSEPGFAFCSYAAGEYSALGQEFSDAIETDVFKTAKVISGASEEIIYKAGSGEAFPLQLSEGVIDYSDVFFPKIHSSCMSIEKLISGLADKYMGFVGSSGENGSQMFLVQEMFNPTEVNWVCNDKDDPRAKISDFNALPENQESCFKIFKETAPYVGTNYDFLSEIEYKFCTSNYHLFNDKVLDCYKEKIGEERLFCLKNNLEEIGEIRDDLKNEPGVRDLKRISVSKLEETYADKISEVADADIRIALLSPRSNYIGKVCDLLENSCYDKSTYNEMIDELINSKDLWSVPYDLSNWYPEKLLERSQCVYELSFSPYFPQGVYRNYISSWGDDLIPVDKSFYHLDDIYEELYNKLLSEQPDSCDETHSVKVHDTENWELVQEIRGIKGVSKLESAGDTLVLGEDTDSSINIFKRSDDGELLTEIVNIKTKDPEVFALSKDASKLYHSIDIGSKGMFGVEIVNLLDLNEKRGKITYMFPKKYKIEQIEISSDSKMLAVTMSNIYLYLFNLESGKLMKKIYTGKYGPDSDGDGHNDKVDTCEDYPNPDQSIKEAEAAGSWCDENPYEYRAPLVKFLPGSKDIMVFWDLRYQSLDEDLRNEGATLIAFDEEGSFYKEGQALIFKGTSSKPHLSKEIYGTEIYSADFLAKEAGGHLLVINKGFVIDLDSQELVGYVNLRSNGSVNIRSLRGVSSEGMAVGINGRFVEMIKDIKGDPQLWLDYPLNLGGALGNTTDNLLQFAFGGDLLITESFIVDPFLHLLSDVLQSVRGEGISGGALSQSIDDTRGHSASPKKDQEEAKLFAEEIAEINTIYSLNGQEIDLKSCLSEEIDIKLSERAVSLFDYIVLGLSGYGIYCGDLEARFADVNGEGDYYDFVEDRLLKGYWSEYMFSEDEYGPTMVVAKKYCEDLGNGWRLPNFYEAHSLVTNINRKVSDIAIHPIFTDVEWGSYGTHTGTMIGSDMTYWVSYGYGGGWMESSALEGTSHFRCFRPISD